MLSDRRPLQLERKSRRGDNAQFGFEQKEAKAANKNKSGKNSTIAKRMIR
jgi:hypothetical protein